MKKMILMTLIAFSTIGRADIPSDPLIVDDGGNCTLFANTRIDQIEADNTYAKLIAQTIVNVSADLNGAGNVKVLAQYENSAKRGMYQCLVNMIQFRDVKCKRSNGRGDFDGGNLKASCAALQTELNQIKQGL